MEAKQLKSEADESEGISKHRRVKRRRAFREADASQRTSKHRRVKHRRAFREADASQGTSKHRRIKYWYAFRNQSDGGSPSHHVSREQQETDASEGVSKHPQVEHNKVKLANAAQQHTNRGCGRPLFKRTIASTPSAIAVVKRLRLEQAETALKFYEKNQVAEFETLEVLDFCGLRLQHPDPVLNTNNYRAHISFTAKSKNAGDVSPKHFFGELFLDDRSGDFHATFCSTFEPSDDPGFDHGCVICSVICSPDQKFHPADGYVIGRPPWYIPEIRK